MPRPRPFTIWLLMVVFIYSAWRDFYSLFRYQHVTDYVLLAHVNLGPLFFIAIGVPWLGTLASLYFLFRPRPLGFLVILATIAVSMVAHVALILLAIEHLDVAKEAYEKSRQARGLPIRPESADVIFSPMAMHVTLGVTILLALGFAALTIWNRAYFVDTLARTET